MLLRVRQFGEAALVALSFIAAAIGFVAIAIPPVNGYIIAPSFNVVERIVSGTTSLDDYSCYGRSIRACYVKYGWTK